jgi:serine/threonine protein kinase
MARDRYEIISPIGSRGLGTVYKARDTQLNRRAAIKRLKSSEDGDARDPEDEQKLLQEASLTGGIEYPNIVAVYCWRYRCRWGISRDGVCGWRDSY